MRQEKLNKREGEKAKRKSQDCWVTFMLKNEILLSAHAQTSQANFWRLDQSRGRSWGRMQGVRTPPPKDDLRFSTTTGILQKKKTMWFIGVEVEQETSAPPSKKNPGSAPAEGPEVFDDL